MEIGTQAPTEIQLFLHAHNIPFRKSGDEISVQKCPHCHPGTEDPTNQFKLYVNQQKGVFNCHRCATRGTWPDLKVKLERTS